MVAIVSVRAFAVARATGRYADVSSGTTRRSATRRPAGRGLRAARAGGAGRAGTAGGRATCCRGWSSTSTSSRTSGCACGCPIPSPRWWARGRWLSLWSTCCPEPVPSGRHLLVVAVLAPWLASRVLAARRLPSRPCAQTCPPRRSTSSVALPSSSSTAPPSGSCQRWPGRTPRWPAPKAAPPPASGWARSLDVGRGLGAVWAGLALGVPGRPLRRARRSAPRGRRVGLRSPCTGVFAGLAAAASKPPGCQRRRAGARHP